MKCRAKFSDAMNMSRISTSSTAGDLKYAMLASWVEKPPNPTTENEWQIASNHDMPQTRRLTMAPPVRVAYTIHSDFAVSVMRGASLSSLMGPGASAL